MELYPHQKEILEKSKDLKKVGYMLEMGLGKTYLASERIKHLDVEEHIVVCQKSKVDDWVNHFIEHYPEFTIIDLTRPHGKQIRHNGGDICVGVINYELFWRRPDFVPRYPYSLTLDESSLIGNEKAKQTKFITKLRPTYLTLLSGTPTGGKYEKFFTQLKMLGYQGTREGYYGKYIIQRQIMTASGLKITVPTGQYKNVPELMRAARTYNCFFLKTEDVLDLPEQTFITLNVDSTPEYRKFVKERIVKYKDKEIVGDMTFTKLLGERQLCGQFNLNKIVSFKDILESTEDRLIVFYNFNEELQQMLSVTDKPISMVNGQKRDLTAYENEHNSVTFIQYKAGSMGLNLQKANKIVYFSPTLSANDYSQSQKRIHRIGQTGTCFYYKMITKGSVEEKIYKALDRGVDYELRLFESEEQND